MNFTEWKRNREFSQDNKRAVIITINNSTREHFTLAKSKIELNAGEWRFIPPSFHFSYPLLNRCPFNCSIYIHFDTYLLLRFKLSFSPVIFLISLLCVYFLKKIQFFCLHRRD